MTSSDLRAALKRHGLVMLLGRLLGAAIGGVPVVVGWLMLGELRDDAKALAPLNALVGGTEVGPSSGPGELSGAVMGESDAPALTLVEIESRSSSGSSSSYTTHCVLRSASEIEVRSYGDELTVALPEPWGPIQKSNLTTAGGWALVRLGEPGSRSAATEEQLARCPSARDAVGPTQRTLRLMPATELTIYGCREGNRVEPCADGGSIVVTNPADEALSLWADDGQTLNLVALGMLLIGGLIGGGVVATGQLHNTGRRRDDS